MTDGVRCGFITTGDGDGAGEGGEVTAPAGVTSVAVGTDSLAEDEESLGGTAGGRDDGGRGGGRDGGGGLLEETTMAEAPAESAASDWAKSWAFLRGEAVFLEMARPCGSVW